MEGELIGVFEQIEREKGIPKKELLEMIESALTSAFRKHSGKKQKFEAHVDPESGVITAYVRKKVVSKVENPYIQITKKEALKLDPAVKVGDEIKIKVETKEFGRIAAQTAKQVIVQRIRETERENLFKEFKEKEGTAMNAVVQRFARKNIIVDLGKVEATLPEWEQIRDHKYELFERFKVYILKVEQSPRGPKITVSRTHPGLVKRLYELEVPEVNDHTVEIKQIVREPGYRCKVAVLSNNEKVDPVGACVGVKGSRVQAIINELNGERMDLIAYSSEPATYVASSLSPAKVLNVSMEKEKKNALVVVADDQLSLAIGKAGQNVRLAARLTGWHIDIKSESQMKKAKEVVVSDLTKLSGVGKVTAKLLSDNGFTTMEKIASSSVSELTKISGIGPKFAEKIYSAAKKEGKANEGKRTG
ncbi:transcription termination/antitermination protein NusA [bacterium]|nr:transcription termination/antitermination protein NusA [bacterium]NIN93033.1 transcription termination/antitermination protein NusA [bacterium]NIO18902.1 transcription termination/antitermination protein NusA [bacterium]NIO73983.1 transcription termination/antitermination protein NusA [bacterium]